VLHLGRMILELTIVALGAYLIGSIPFGLLLTKAAGLGDIRTIGSGNIGATNVLRTGNKKLAALTLLLDGLKGWLGVYLLIPMYKIYFLISHHQTINMNNFSNLNNEILAYIYFFIAISMPAFIVLGHCFPIWLKFKGGKGVATSLGVALALYPPIGLGACLTWLVIAFIFRISSLAALIAMISLPCLAYVLGEPAYIELYIFIAALVFYRHKDNIKRLLAGTEPKIGQKK